MRMTCRSCFLAFGGPCTLDRNQIRTILYKESGAGITAASLVTARAKRVGLRSFEATQGQLVRPSRLHRPWVSLAL